jgi:hypothetical protein
MPVESPRPQVRGRGRRDVNHFRASLSLSRTGAIYFQQASCYKRCVNSQEHNLSYRWCFMLQRKRECMQAGQWFTSLWRIVRRDLKDRPFPPHVIFSISGFFFDPSRVDFTLIPGPSTRWLTGSTAVPWYEVARYRNDKISTTFRSSKPAEALTRHHVQTRA